ncbi:hypothetical protein [Bathymodiolus japonicus methanotrophic gill symbiont]|uniref:hypothetical protein n=1 Tax=Bathymodiolus japonicus methanotrophic gill symbiont TaxID=113269 RepID=UPI001C8EDE5F|nr:hypothetical protein [Bathymodiolus japonicus methanotrophic gill symbiont]
MRKLVLGIPAQASSKNLTRPLMPSAAQTSCVRATSPHHRKLGAGYVALPQMTGPRFGIPFFVSTLATAQTQTQQRPYGYRGLKIFTSLKLRFQGFQRM